MKTTTQYRISIAFTCDCGPFCLCLLEDEEEIYKNKDDAYKAYNLYTSTGKWADKIISSASLSEIIKNELEFYSPDIYEVIKNNSLSV